MCEILKEKEYIPRDINRTTHGPSGISYCKYISKIAENIRNNSSNLRNFVWLDNVYFCCPWNVLEMTTGHNYDTGFHEIQKYPAVFKLRMKKLSSSYIEIHLLRNFERDFDTDYGYFLRIFFEIEDSLCSGKFTDMSFITNVASVSFPSDVFGALKLSVGSTVVKCGIWMYELLPVVYEASVFAEHSLQRSSSEYESLTGLVHDDLAHLPRCHGVKNLFSCRHGDDIVKEKFLILKRTILFSKILTGRKRCFENNQPVDNTINIDLILGYIYNGIIHVIEKQECFHLFRMSFVHGLPFLQDECEGFLASSLTDDCDFLVDVIALANAFERWKLLDVGLDYFFKHYERVLNCERWKTLLSDDPYQVRLIQTLVKRTVFYVGRECDIL